MKNSLSYFLSLSEYTYIHIIYVYIHTYYICIYIYDTKEKMVHPIQLLNLENNLNEVNTNSTKMVFDKKKK